jgi:hypothetical protein
MRHLPLVAPAALAAALAVASCSAAASSTAAAPAASHPAAKATAKASPKPGCTASTANYLVYSSEPGTTPAVGETGSCDLATGQPVLAGFAATAGQAPGECTTIALASSNPGYNVNAASPAPLKGVIESAGPGCR